MTQLEAFYKFNGKHCPELGGVVLLSYSLGAGLTGRIQPATNHLLVIDECAASGQFQKQTLAFQIRDTVTSAELHLAGVRFEKDFSQN